MTRVQISVHTKTADMDAEVTTPTASYESGTAQVRPLLIEAANRILRSYNLPEITDEQEKP